MDRDPAFAATYMAQIEKLIENGYAPARFEGKPLNDCLASGLDLLNRLIGILFRFRIGSVDFTGDIKDMFLRIRLHAPDQRAQLFLSRGADRECEPCLYTMTLLIFGGSSSQISVIYVLNRNAETYSDEYPNAEVAVKRDHYVDDFIRSTDLVSEAVKLISNVTVVHARGGYDIREYLAEVRNLSELWVAQCYALRLSKIELLGDASEHAYAAVAYWKQQRPFDADDVVNTETRLPNASQKRAFNDEIRAAAVGAATSRGSSLKTLNVLLADGWLKVGGHLRCSPALSFDEKYPIILDGRDHAIRLLIEH
ncbi:hypothetical protein EVAR_38026_1 [Eumeta japonica]|uniref:Uncharacterized protein n=1 Tax=Eumeta variegata TaxID=151549 RepID=A0A4C1W9S4_EUMVA|nr:hypothetical protein EVAR_38026_1 [Eumeta japonica]